MGRTALYSRNDFTEEVTGFKVFKVSNEPSSRIIGAPVENGMVVFDNKVIDPARVVVSGQICIVEDFSGNRFGDSMKARSEIIRMFNSRQVGSSAGNTDKLFSVSDGDECFDNLMLESYKKTREATKYDLAEYELVFKKVMFVQKYNAGLVGEHSDVRNNGYQKGVSA